MITREYCVPCMLQLQKTHELKRIGGRNHKITCWKCRRRRYGTEYEVKRKGKAVKSCE